MGGKHAQVHGVEGRAGSAAPASRVGTDTWRRDETSWGKGPQPGAQPPCRGGGNPRCQHAHAVCSTVTSMRRRSCRPSDPALPPDDDFLQGAQVPVQVLAELAEIQDGVQHQLAGAVVRHLQAPRKWKPCAWRTVQCSALQGRAAQVCPAPQRCHPSAADPCRASLAVARHPKATAPRSEASERMPFHTGPHLSPALRPEQWQRRVAGVKLEVRRAGSGAEGVDGRVLQEHNGARPVPSSLHLLHQRTLQLPCLFGSVCGAARRGTGSRLPQAPGRGPPASHAAAPCRAGRLPPAGASGYSKHGLPLPCNQILPINAWGLSSATVCSTGLADAARLGAPPRPCAPGRTVSPDPRGRRP